MSAAKTLRTTAWDARAFDDICFVNIENMQKKKDARNSAYRQTVTVVFDIRGAEPDVVRQKLEDLMKSWPGAAAAAGVAPPTCARVPCEYRSSPSPSSPSSPPSPPSALPSPPRQELDLTNLEDALASLHPDNFSW